MKLAIAFILLAASVAAGQPKKLYIAPITDRDGISLDERTHNKLSKEFTKQCPDLVTVSRFPGSVYEIKWSYFGVQNIFNITDLFRLDVVDPDPLYRTRATSEKNTVKDVCNYLRGRESGR
jgi:hypothetical protein